MRIKEIFFGLGIGLVSAAFIFFIVMKVMPPELPSQNNVLTEQDIIDKAKKLGMTFEGELQSKEEEKKTEAELPTESQTYVQEEIKNIENETEKQSLSTEADFSQKEQETEISSEISTNTQEESTKAEKLSTENISISTEDGKISVRIPGGVTAYKAVQILYEAGAIDSVEGFNSYIVSQNKTKEIRAGYYNIPKGSSYEEVLKILIDRNR